MRIAIAASLVLSLTVTNVARADEAPDRDSIEAHCTPPEQCPSGVVCPRAVGNKDIGEACRAEAAAKKLELRCGRGATHRQELYCPHGEKGSWTKGCSVGGDAPAGSALAALGCLAALGVLRRRRRASGVAAAPREGRRTS